MNYVGMNNELIYIVQFMLHSEILRKNYNFCGTISCDIMIANTADFPDHLK